jgi:FAD/FMN-containing dehydrogenase
VLSRRTFLARAGGAALAASPAWRAVGAGGPADARLRALAGQVRGPLLTPADRAYGRARLVVNARYDDVQPLAVLRAAGADDVRAAVRWARRTGVPIVARSGGHSYAGYSTTRGLVVDLGALASVRPDPAGATALVGAGARLVQVDAALARRGLAIPTGSCPSVGIGGLALGGGVGFSSRAWGTTSDNVVAVDVVTADGRLLTCDARHHADLLWACRGGGGGNFGIVTRFRLRVHRVRGGSWFTATFPWAAVEEVVARWQRWAPEGPDALFSLVSLSSGGGTPTVRVLGQFLGPEGPLRALLRGLTRAAAPSSLAVGRDGYLGLQLRWAGCLGESVTACAVPPHLAFAGKSDYVSRPLPAHGIATLARQVDGSARAGGGAILLDSYGGAINRVPASATAFVHRDNLFSFQYYAGWSAPGAARASLGWLRAARAAMRPWVSGLAYQNYIDPELQDWPRAYYGRNLARLVEVKRRYDPDGLFRFRQGIRPAG